MRGVRTSRKLVLWSSRVLMLATLACFSATLALAQNQCNTTQAFNTVYRSSGCTQTTQGSFAFVDATQYPRVGSDICGPIQSVLTKYANGLSGQQRLDGVVVDARGFTSGTLTCTTNPWSGALPHSNVVLLPAGTISVSQTLVMPGNTRLVGVGSGFTAGAGSTTLAVSGSFTGDLIDMGNSNVCPANNNTFDCPSVVIEHLAIQGAPSGGAAIRNQYSQELSYVDDVVLSNLGPGTTGLWLDVHANNSGPYSNIRYSGSGTCVQIFDSMVGGTLMHTRRQR
jgi:hypothetical protein